MSSKKSRLMPPPPVPPQRGFAPGLAIRKPKVDPYDPTPRTASTDAFSFLRTDTETDTVSGTWTTIDPDTGARAWDEERRRQSMQGSDASSVRSASRPTTPAPDSWMQWALPGAPSTMGESSTASSPPRTGDTGANVDSGVRRLFVDTRDIMLDNARPTTLFEKRNQKSLAKGNTTKIKNMIGGEVVSIVHNPIDDRAKYRDSEGNYVDGIDRGKMKKRYENEWRSRLDNRTAQMEHLTKIKQAWEALSPAERARQIEKREANAKLVSLLGAGLQSRTDLYEFDETPEIYRRTKKWTLTLERLRESSIAGSDIRSVASGSFSDVGSAKTITDPHNYHVAGGSRGGLPPTSRRHNTPNRETCLGKRRPSDRSDDDFWSSDNGFSFDSPSDDNHVQRYAERDTHRPGKRPPAGPRHQRPPSGPLAMRNSYNHNWPLSVAPSGQYSGFSIPPHPTGKASSISNVSYQSSKATPSVASETITAKSPALELALLKDLSARKKDYDDDDGAMDKFDQIVELCSKSSRIVQMTLLGRVEYGSSAVSDRIFSGRVQEIQYFPAERMALIVFLVPGHAAAFVRHVQNLRAHNEHEYRRLQINAEWYRGLEKEAIYPAQTWTLASVLVDDASRVLHISHVSVDKKVQDFADDMKLAFPDKVVVKVDDSSPKSTKGYF